MTVLLIDNYDSFVFNLARYFERLGQGTTVLRNTAIDVAGVRALAPDALVLSPGPCTPRQAGCSLELVRELHGELPILGVCLGHQAIAEALHARIIRAVEPVHGTPRRLFTGDEASSPVSPSPLVATRYHSLVVEEQSVPPVLEVTARTEDGTIMALQHRRFPVVGLQFHPESILTEYGYPLLAAFLRLAKLSVPETLPAIGDELRTGGARR